MLKLVGLAASVRSSMLNKSKIPLKSSAANHVVVASASGEILHICTVHVAVSPVKI